MKYTLRYLVFCAVTLIFINVTAQKHDYIWLGGYDGNIGVTDSNNEYEITKLDFNTNPKEKAVGNKGILYQY